MELGLDNFKKYQRDKKRTEKKSAREAAREKAIASEPAFKLPQDARAVDFEELLRRKQANEHIVPVDPDEDD